MSKEIVNRVANSPLVTIDLESFYPEGRRLQIDISQWLTEGILLKEKEFRAHLSSIDWTQYNDAYVAVNCSTEAVVPGWANMLVCLQLAPFAKKVVIGDLEDLENEIFIEVIDKLKVDDYKDVPVIIAGCSNKPIPENTYAQLAQKLMPVVKSLMYGEACSAVPMFKRPKK